MTTVGPDAVYVHFGRRIEGNARHLASIAGGAALTGSWKPADTQTIAEYPLLMQWDQKDLSAATLWGTDDDWFLAQQGRVSAYTTPVVYVDSRHRSSGDPTDRSLAEAVQAAERFRELVRVRDPGKCVLTVMGVHWHWLSRDSTALVGRLREVDGPAALLVQHDADPFESPRALEGMLELIRERGAIGILRTDLAGIGLIANGAELASIGVGTGTRHFTPPGASPFADTTDRSPRLLVEPLLTWWKGTTIAVAGSDSLLRCADPCCAGNDLARFADPALRLEAASHSVAQWASIAQELRTIAPARRADWWTNKVASALNRLSELEDRLYTPQPVCTQLEAWLRVVGVSVP